MFGKPDWRRIVDELDAAIVRELQQNDRPSNRELATRLGLAPSTCLVRTRVLRERRILAGFHAEIDLAQVGLGVQALLAVQVRPLSRTFIEGFRAFAMDLPEVLAVLAVFVLAGGDGFLVHLAVRDLATMHALLMDKFSQRKIDHRVPDLSHLRPRPQAGTHCPVQHPHRPIGVSSVRTPSTPWQPARQAAQVDPAGGSACEAAQRTVSSAGAHQGTPLRHGRESWPAHGVSATRYAHCRGDQRWPDDRHWRDPKPRCSRSCSDR